MEVALDKCIHVNLQHSDSHSHCLFYSR